MAKLSNARTRHWAFIIYPESAPPNWTEILATMCVPAIASPLHDADVNEDGTKKKPHHHVVLIYDGVKSFEQVKEDIEPLGATNPIRVKSLNGTVRYFLHLDNPEKAQYSRNDVREFGGVSFDDYSTKTQSKPLDRIQRHNLLKEMRQFIAAHDIIDFHTFIDWCDENNDEWSRAIDESCTNQVVAYMRAMYLKQQRQREEAAFSAQLAAYDRQNKTKEIDKNAGTS